MSTEIERQISALATMLLEKEFEPTVALVSRTLCPGVGHNQVLGQLVESNTTIYCSWCIPPGIIYVGPDQLLEMNLGHLN